MPEDFSTLNVFPRSALIGTKIDWEGILPIQCPGFKPKAELLEIVSAIDPLGSRPGVDYCWQDKQQESQHGNDCDQLAMREGTIAALSLCRHPNADLPISGH